MKRPNPERQYHVVEFRDDMESDAFVRALQRWLSSPVGRLWAEDMDAVEIWSSPAVTGLPVSLFLNDTAEEATEEGFAPATIVRAVQGSDVPNDCTLVLLDITLSPQETT